MKTALRNASYAIPCLIAAGLFVYVARTLYHRDHSIGSALLLIVAALLFNICTILFGILFREWWTKWQAYRSAKKVGE